MLIPKTTKFVEENYNIEEEAATASLFTTGNGYIGVRGSFEEYGSLRIQGAYIRGVIDEVIDVVEPFADNEYMKKYYFDEENNKIFFHSGKVGHKLDAIAKSDKVSFCVYDNGYHKDGHWSLNIRSVIIFGRIRILDDWSDELMVKFCKRFTSDMDYIHSEIEKFKNNTAVLCLEIEHMTGKLVNEA